MATNRFFAPELGPTDCSINDLTITSMTGFLDKKNTIQLVESKTFKGYQVRLKKLGEVSDYLTFPGLVCAVRVESGIENDLSFRTYGFNELGVALSIGTPEYMAKEGIVLLATSLTYPEQFKARDYHPDSPDDSDNDFYYPEVSLALELFARNAKGTTRGCVRWVRFPSCYFPKDAYIPYKERLRFDGTWDECMSHYTATVKKMMRLGKKELKK